MAILPRMTPKKKSGTYLEREVTVTFTVTKTFRIMASGFHDARREAKALIHNGAIRITKADLKDLTINYSTPLNRTNVKRLNGKFVPPRRDVSEE